MIGIEKRLQTALARLVGQALGAALHDRLGHSFERNAALHDAAELLKELCTPPDAYHYPVGAIAQLKAEQHGIKKSPGGAVHTNVDRTPALLAGASEGGD